MMTWTISSFVSVEFIKLFMKDTQELGYSSDIDLIDTGYKDTTVIYIFIKSIYISKYV